ncbi:hypothetical protein H8K35_10020 [Undibacterium sp. LX40W]|uniref:Uncharacterized protein n=1 Tax=Undibacterium nitidum TaxID=2762298 RepID=A0A923HXH0_9BURK|nr:MULTISPECIES: hypothetical protein [Undibacterium]MBC3882011.1 hypothetical protein [Undibacterium nitidum]MBC3891993.1 hypothetical protein [Undibacterium sp. LX40W]
MISLFKSAHSGCSRCAQPHHNDTRFCSVCGLDFDAPAQHVLLAPDEVAIGFHATKLGDFLALHAQHAHQLHIQIFQYGQVHDLTQDQALSVDKQSAAGIFITRKGRFDVNVVVDDLHTAEFLPLQANIRLQLHVAQTREFAEQFMSGSCRVTLTDLQTLFSPSVRQQCLEMTNAHTLRELQDQVGLQQHLQQEIKATLAAQLEKLGLALDRIQVQELRHDKLSSARESLGEKLGSLYLIIDHQRANNAHRKQIDALYSEAEWQQIARDEERVRLRYRREEMRQQLGNDLSWLYLRGEHENAKKRLSRAKLRQDEAERLHAIQLRELELYARIAEASTRKQAIEQGAASAVQELEHQLREKKDQQQNEVDEWLHIRTLARIKMRSESELAQMHSKEAAQLLQQKIEHQLQAQRLEHDLEVNQRQQQSLRQQEQAAWLHEQQRQLQLREQALEEEAHQTRLLSLSLETEVRAREFKRIQAWEDELAQQRQQQLQSESVLKAQQQAVQMATLKQQIAQLEHQQAQQQALAQHDKLSRTLALEAQYAELEQQRQQQSHVAQAQAELEVQLRKFEAIAALSETSKIAVADQANAAMLTDVLKLQTMAAMSPEQILAIQAAQSEHAAQAVAEVKRQTHGLSWEDTVRMLHERVQEERAQRQAEQERRHEIDLQNAQGLAFARTPPYGPLQGK